MFSFIGDKLLIGNELINKFIIACEFMDCGSKELKITILSGGYYLRNRAYLRNMRRKSIQRKKRISNSVYGFDWYKHDGQYSKGKIHCGCGLCKFGKKYGLQTIKCMRERSEEKILRRDFENDLCNIN